MLFSCGPQRKTTATDQNMTNLSRLTTLAAATLVIGATVSERAQAQAITEWNFNNLAMAINTSPAPSIGAGAASSVGMNSAYNGTQTFDISDVTNSTPLSSDPGTPNYEWRIRGGTSAGTNTATTNGWSSNAPLGDQGAQFLASTAGYAAIIVSFDWSPTAQGERNLQLQYTLDGSTYSNVPQALFTSFGTGATAVGATNLPTSGDTNTVAGGFIEATSSTAYMNGITANLTSIVGAANDPSFGIRMVNASTGADDVNVAGSALNNTSGNWRFDEVTISGTSLALVPEPTSIMLVAAGMVGGGLFLRSRRHQAV